jgi:hypothetical protein
MAVRPLPLSENADGLFVALLLIVNMPVRLPSTVGVNVTVIAQVALTSKGGPQVSVSLNSEAFAPLITILDTFKIPVPVLVRVTVWGALVDP